MTCAVGEGSNQLAASQYTMLSIEESSFIPNRRTDISISSLVGEFLGFLAYFRINIAQ